MQAHAQKEVVGFVELQVGSLEVKVPLQVEPGGRAPDDAAEPLAVFEVEGDTCGITLRGDASSPEVKRAVRVAAEAAVRHLSRKLLN